MNAKMTKRVNRQYTKALDEAQKFLSTCFVYKFGARVTYDYIQKVFDMYVNIHYTWMLDNVFLEREKLHETLLDTDFCRSNDISFKWVHDDGNCEYGLSCFRNIAIIPFAVDTYGSKLYLDKLYLDVQRMISSKVCNPTGLLFEVKWVDFVDYRLCLSMIYEYMKKIPNVTHVDLYAAHFPCPIGVRLSLKIVN